MSKLTLDDVRIIGEGSQIRKAIELRYNSLEEFYTVHSNITKLYNTFLNYLSRDAITSDTFKCKITRILDVDYPSLYITKEKQINNHVNNIYENIIKYNQQEDQEVLDYLLMKCKKENMQLEIAMMYRAKARNYYYTNWMNHCEEFYKYAIEALTDEDINYKVFFSCEFAYDLVKEYLLETAEKKFKYIEDLVKKHKNSLDDNTLHYYYYWRGVMYLNCNKNAHAREFFHEAFEYAKKNFEKTSSLSNIGLSYFYNERYDKALEYYHKALKFHDESRILATASVYNNMAVTYYTINDFTNALLYIEKALDILRQKHNLTKLLIYTETHVEIQMKLGDPQAYKLYFDALLSTKGKQMNKFDLINNTKAFINNINKLDCLGELMDIIIELKDAVTSSGYRQGLYECLGYIAEKTRKLSKGVYNEKVR